MHTSDVCVCVCMCVWGARATQRHTRHHRCSRVCEWSLHVCTCARVCWSTGTISLISLLCLFVCRCTPWHKHTHTHASNTKNTGKYEASNDRKTTLALKHSSVLSHDKHTHKPKRWKPVKNAGWQGRQLVVGQIKIPVSTRNRELGHQLSGILIKANKQITNIYTYIHASESIERGTRQTNSSSVVSKLVS